MGFLSTSPGLADSSGIGRESYVAGGNQREAGSPDHALHAPHGAREGMYRQDCRANSVNEKLDSARSQYAPGMVNPGRCPDGQVVTPDDLPESVATRILINTIMAWHILEISLRALSTTPHRIVKSLSKIAPRRSGAQTSVISRGSRCRRFHAAHY